MKKMDPRELKKMADIARVKGEKEVNDFIKANELETPTEAVKGLPESKVEEIKRQIQLELFGRKIVEAKAKIMMKNKIPRTIGNNQLENIEKLALIHKMRRREVEHKKAQLKNNEIVEKSENFKSGFKPRFLIENEVDQINFEITQIEKDLKDYGYVGLP